MKHNFSRVLLSSQSSSASIRHYVFYVKIFLREETTNKYQLKKKRKNTRGRTKKDKGEENQHADIHMHTQTHTYTTNDSSTKQKIKWRVKGHLNRVRIPTVTRLLVSIFSLTLCTSSTKRKGIPYSLVQAFAHHNSVIAHFHV